MSHPKHQNQVRIIGGTHRGRKITFAVSDGLRPTPDSVREKLFNWLGQDMTGQTVLDLFAGSGALGFEAASRGAGKIVMIEADRQTAQNLNRHREQFGWDGTVFVCCRTAAAFLNNTAQTFDTVFLDPPFAWQEWPVLFVALKGRLKTDARVYIEAARLPELPEWLTVLREGRAGQSRHLLARVSAGLPN
ncbi:Ribosomal RNA small subunit methyltransferase D [Kingella potus]|uniref:Ribosomal RNA small subunit methyltransferase D n=1 Tax=Kingella potus TaxID=265175 RepID=A0A377R3W7_9NEIS|nr:16S rRNA (guanine(966)-N(2))-methyltransferase RsmD [Kingella potus]STR03013.1 Ribosomal RNA small subunit methyltransferase D [Kingella potus]